MYNDRSFYPEKLVFWGAGATANLDMPTTAQLGSAIRKLMENEADACYEMIADELLHFLAIVEVPLEKSHRENPKSLAALHALFPQKTEREHQKVAMRYRQVYDWEALKAIAKLVKGDDLKFMAQLYDLLDGSIVQSSGISVEIDGSGTLLYGERVWRARKLLDCLSILAYSSAYAKILEKEPEKLSPYIRFVEDLAQLMEDEGIALYESFVSKASSISEESFFASRAFYLFSYAIASMNYEPVFLWLLWNAHKKQNANPSCLGKNDRKLKLLNDHSLFFGIRNLEKGEPQNGDSIWFPCNEPVAKRSNSHAYDPYVIRIGKFFYPHGNLNFRECPNCGKLNVSFGAEWKNESPTLFAHGPFPDKLSKYYTPKESEKSAFDEGFQDAQECVFCGNLLHFENSAIVFQTSFKGRHAPFIEEIQRDMKIAVEKARHIVLLGYSLPEDDVIWRGVMASKNEGDKFCSVVCGHKGEKRWLQGEELLRYQENYQDKNGYGCDAIQHAMAIFGEKNVRAYTGGIPEVWNGGMESVRELLYPQTFFHRDICEERVKKFVNRQLNTKGEK